MQFRQSNSFGIPIGPHDNQTMSQKTSQTKIAQTGDAVENGDAENSRKEHRLTVDGLKFKALVQAGYLWLRHQEEVVNAYNVYPVPDGDTGTNMMHTMRSAWEAVAGLDERHAGAMAKAVANGALRGSRGNSGIILSQLWRGFARSIEQKDIIDAQDLAAAFREAAKTAYTGVANPVEGTILTVARETADSVEVFINHSHDLRALLEHAKQAAYDSTQRTPQHLKILRDAGVIDSGGYGFFTILEGMFRAIHGQDVGTAEAGAAKARAAGMPVPVDGLSIEGGWGYDVQYLIYAPSGKQLDVTKIRATIEAMGDCPLVMGDEAVVKVHVHVPDPGVPISYGAQLGSLRDVVVEDMQAQSESFVPGAAGSPVAKTETELDEVDVAVIAVASGDGLVQAFKDVGVRTVIQGGQTMNPSVDDFLNAIDRVRARAVLLLPNNGNIVMTAQQAAELSKIPARVVTTKTIPQGIAAALGFNYTASVEDNFDAMSASAARVTTGEITISTRNVTINEVTVTNGQTIGLINDKLAVAGSNVIETTLALLAKTDAGAHELITLYYGNGLSESDAEAYAAKIREAYPGQQVDLFRGDQPHYFFVIGVE
jgi:uncharacterized protein